MYLRCLVECLAHSRFKRVFIRLDLRSWQILLPQTGTIFQFVGKRSYTQRHYESTLTLQRIQSRTQKRTGSEEAGGVRAGAHLIRLFLPLVASTAALDPAHVQQGSSGFGKLPSCQP